MADKIADMQQNITTDLRLDSDLRPDFEKVHNLLPAVVVDTNTKEVLMRNGGFAVSCVGFIG